MSFPFPSSHRCFILFLEDNLKHANNNHMNLLKVSSKCLLYFLQNNYNYLIVWQVNLPQVSYTMLSYQHVAMSTCLLYHTDLSFLSYQFVYIYFLVMSTCLHILSYHVNLLAYLLIYFLFLT